MIADEQAATAAPPCDPSGGCDPDDLVHELYRVHAVPLIRAAKILLRDQQSAEDVVQDAFIGLYRAWPRLSNHDQVLPYLRTCVLNGCRSILRSRKRAQTRRVVHEVPSWSAESVVIDGQDRLDVMAAMARLPRRSREVLVLRYYLDLPESEIAAALGISRGTVSSTASRALAAIARDLKEGQ